MKWKVVIGAMTLLPLMILPILTACAGDTTVINERTVTLKGETQTITITNPEAKTVTQIVTIRPVADLVVSPHSITGEYQGLPYCYTCHPVPADHQGLIQTQEVCFECHVGTP